jgi:hypothetical protein
VLTPVMQMCVSRLRMMKCFQLLLTYC